MEAQKAPQESRKEGIPSLKTSSGVPSTVTTAMVSTSHLGALSVLTKALAASPSASAPTLSVIVPTTSSLPGGTVLVSAPALLRPPPLIAAVSAQAASTPAITALSITKTSVKPKISQLPSTISGLAGIIKKSGGGLGAGKPKAFLALMASATKKQPAKKAPPGASKAGKGQGNKSKPSSSATTPSRKVEQQVPSRTSNRSIKRPRTYDEDLDDLKALKSSSSSSKKAKGTPKVSVTVKIRSNGRGRLMNPWPSASSGWKSIF